MNAPATPSALVSGPLTHRQTMWIVAGVLLPVFMGSMDQSVVASALPTIGRSLGNSNYLSWVVAANLMMATAMTPLYGKISDIIGRRQTLLISISLYLIGSMVSALADSLPLLILGRALQGLGSGGLTSLPMAILGDIAAPKARARYYTYFSIVYITAGALGPLYGGFIAEHMHYSAIFWSNLPLGFLALAVTGTLLKRLPRHERPHKLDVLGAVLIVLASASFMFVVNAGGHNLAWLSKEIVAVALVSVVAWVCFIIRLLTAREPLIPLGLMRTPIVRHGTMANAVGWASVIVLNIYLPMFLQAVHGYSPSQSGAALMIFMMTVNGGALVGAQLAARLTHYKYPPLFSILFSVGGCIWLAVRVSDINVVEFQVVLAVIGLGFGPVAPVSTVSVQNAIELHQMGVVTGTMSFVRSIIATALVAIFGVIILGGASRGVDAAAVEGASHMVFGDTVAAAGQFRILFLATAATFSIVFLSLVLLEERPLMAERTND
jgi:EmrB/QacA subfamily drug resistance transporter